MGRPWQKLAADLVGPMPETPGRSKWILVFTDRFSICHDALAIPEVAAPTAAALDKWVLCYPNVSQLRRVKLN